MQLPLLDNSPIKKELKSVPISDIIISKFNPRITRPEEDIKNLAQRISRNGYEITRALWVYQNGNGYEAFAGGTRLEAAKRAGCKTIPVLLHEGLTDEDIVKLSEEDNENDEYHNPVPCVDVWLSYKILKEDMGWMQEQIAQAKGVSQTFVSFRLKLADLPEAILSEFINNNSLNERCAIELLKLLTVNNFSPWLTREQALLEIIDEELKGKSPTAQTFKNTVEKYNQVIKLVSDFNDELTPEYSEQFLNILIEQKARSKAVVQFAIDEITKQIAIDKERAEYEAKIRLEVLTAEARAAEEQARLVKEREQWFNDNIILQCADFRRVDIPPDSIDFIFTDPPYDEQSISLYGDLAQFGATVLKPGGSLIVYAGHYALPDIFDLMRPHLRYWWLISLEHSGNSARLLGKGVFVEWKPLIWFVKETRGSKNYVTDLFKSSPPKKENHKWEQDISEAKYYIEHLTNPGDLVLDPMMGSGTTLEAAIALQRKVWGIDIKQKCIDITQERLYGYYTSK